MSYPHFGAIMSLAKQIQPLYLVTELENHTTYSVVLSGEGLTPYANMVLVKSLAEISTKHLCLQKERNLFWNLEQATSKNWRIIN
jgi:hypothetical protein